MLHIYLWFPSGEESIENISKGQANLKKWLGQADQMDLLLCAISIDTLWLAAKHHNFCQSLSGMKQNPAVHRKKPSVSYLCHFFNVKVPSSADKTASIAAPTLISFAAAIVYNSKNGLLLWLLSSMEQSLLVFVPPTSLSIKETLHKGKF